MKWSVSASRTFLQCARKWYYETVFASSKASDFKRKEAFFLKHLQSVHAWRGKIVDQVISRLIVPNLNKHSPVRLDEALGYADRMMDQQLSFAMAHTNKTQEAAEVRVGTSSNCAFIELEYDGGLDQQTIQKAREEARTSLANLFNSNLIHEITEDAYNLVAQRMLQFPFAGVTVTGTPDLIVFFRRKPPLIVDWKVEAPKYKEHWLQLGVYAYALSRAKPHKDFPVELQQNPIDPKTVNLVEFQLLRNQMLRYSLVPDDIVDIEDYIFTSSVNMQKMINASVRGTGLAVDLFPTARSPDACARCKFRRICWRGAI